MKTLIAHLLQKYIAPTGMKAVLATAAMSALPVAAQAHHRDRDDDRPRVHVDLGRVEIGIRRGPVVEVAPAPCPIYEDRPSQVWVEPVYRTVTDQRWVGPEYRSVVHREWVPAQFDVRDVHYGRRISRERVCVVPAHFEDVTQQELVCAGHMEAYTRQELVAPGHYETLVVPVQIR